MIVLADIYAAGEGPDRRRHSRSAIESIGGSAARHAARTLDDVMSTLQRIATR